MGRDRKLVCYEVMVESKATWLESKMKMKIRKFVKVKHAKREFLCALCHAPRQMRYTKNISKQHILQIVVLSGFLSWCLFPLMGWNSAIVFFVVWPGFEIFYKSLYRKEVPCPYCGFDATWYRKDVKVARQKVSDFWANTPERNV